MFYTPVLITDSRFFSSPFCDPWGVMSLLGGPIEAKKTTQPQLLLSSIMNSPFNACQRFTTSALRQATAHRIMGYGLASGSPGFKET